MFKLFRDKTLIETVIFYLLFKRHIEAMVAD